MRGIRTDGVRTFADLQARCRIDDLTGCWLWAGSLSGNGYPVLWLPALRERVTAGTAVCVLKTGRRPAPGVVWHRTCASVSCVNPAHRKAGTRSSQMLAARIEREPITRARIAAAKSAASRLDDEAVADIRASSEPLRVVAERYGVSISCASRVRRGERRAGAARGASVFHLGVGT